MKRLNTQRGLTLLETIIVLAISGIVVALVWIAAADVNFHNQVTQLDRALITTAGRIREFYKDRDISAEVATNPLNNNLAISADLVSADLIYNGNLVHNLSTGGGGTITISSDIAAICPAGVKGFFITLAALRGDACNQIAADLAGSATKISSSNIAKLSVGGADLITNGNFSAATALASCTDGADMTICFQQF